MEELFQCSVCYEPYKTEAERDACKHLSEMRAPDPYWRGQGRPVPRPLKGKLRLKWLKRNR